MSQIIGALGQSGLTGDKWQSQIELKINSNDSVLKGKKGEVITLLAFAPLLSTRYSLPTFDPEVKIDVDHVEVLPDIDGENFSTTCFENEV